MWASEILGDTRDREGLRRFGDEARTSHPSLVAEATPVSMPCRVFTYQRGDGEESATKRLSAA
jgi:hypothetical protein